MKRFSILAFTFVLTAAMLTGCRNDSDKDTSASTQMTSIPPSRADIGRTLL